MLDISPGEAIQPNFFKNNFTFISSTKESTARAVLAAAEAIPRP